MKAKILVVGGGAMGACIALHAARRCDPLTEPVILLEKERLGAGSSGSSSGIIFQCYGHRALAGMARDALKVYANFEATTGRSVGFRRTGVLTLAGPGDPEALARLDASIEMQTSIGIHVERVDAERILEVFPGIEVRPGSLGAWEPESGFVDPIRAIDAFATLARDAGAVMRIAGGKPTVLVEGGRAVGVETDAGVFTAESVVLAIGAWTAPMLEDMDVELPLKVAQTAQHFFRMPSSSPSEADAEGPQPLPEMAADPAWSETETRFTPSPLDRRPVPHPVLFDLDQGFYARCEPALDRTRVGHVQFTGARVLEHPDQLEREPTAESREWARRAVAGRLSAYRDLPATGHNILAVSLTPDLRPIVGPLRQIPGLYVVAGFSGNDFQLAPSIGEGLAQMLWEQPVSAFDATFVSPDRFDPR